MCLEGMAPILGRDGHVRLFLFRSFIVRFFNRSKKSLSQQNCSLTKKTIDFFEIFFQKIICSVKNYRFINSLFKKIVRSVKTRSFFQVCLKHFKSVFFKNDPFFISLNDPFHSSIDTLFHKKKFYSLKKMMPISHPRSIEVYNGISWENSKDTLTKDFYQGVLVGAKCPV